MTPPRRGRFIIVSAHSCLHQPRYESDCATLQNYSTSSKFPKGYLEGVIFQSLLYLAPIITMSLWSGYKQIDIISCPRYNMGLRSTLTSF